MFTHVHMTTIGVENKNRMIEVDNKAISVQLWDTAGQERYKAIASRFYKGVDGIILVYDITSYESFEKIETWIKQVETNTTRTLPFVLVGNKSDLEEERNVPTEEAKEFADKHNFPFIEVSALNKDNIEDLFEIMVK